jgi:hypothetical protein
MQRQKRSIGKQSEELQTPPGDYLRIHPQLSNLSGLKSKIIFT